MAIYRNIHITFWTDSKVVDDFTPEDKYFYIYLLTNPHTNLCGCYEISLKQMSDELGYNKETISRLISRFHEIHKLIEYNPQTKEMLVYNWHKYNWTESPKVKKAIEKELEKIKTPAFKAFLEGWLYGTDTVSIPYEYPMYTTVPATDTDTVTDTDMVGQSPILTIPLKTNENYPLYQADIDNWQRLYPNVDVVLQLRKMSGWSHANPGKRKSKIDILSFINRWLAEEQEKNPIKPSNKQNYNFAELEKKLVSNN